MRAPWFKSVIWTSSSSSSAVPITGDASWAGMGMGMGCVFLLGVMFVFASPPRPEGLGLKITAGHAGPHSSFKSGT